MNIVYLKADSNGNGNLWLDNGDADIGLAHYTSRAYPYIPSS